MTTASAANAAVLPSRPQAQADPTSTPVYGSGAANGSKRGKSLQYVRMRLALDARKLTDFGIGTYITQLVRGLAARPDVELTLVLRAGHEERAASLAPAARLLPVAAAGYSLAEHVRVPAALWGSKVDLVHVPHYVVPMLLRQPVVTTVHDVIQLFYPPARHPHLALLYLRTALRSTLRRSRLVITVSRASRRDLIRLFAADPQRVVVVPNGADDRLAIRPPTEEIEALKRQYQLPRWFWWSAPTGATEPRRGAARLPHRPASAGDAGAARAGRWSGQDTRWPARTLGLDSAVHCLGGCRHDAAGALPHVSSAPA
jgi:hypothetical protein